MKQYRFDVAYKPSGLTSFPGSTQRSPVPISGDENIISDGI